MTAWCVLRVVVSVSSRLSRLAVDSLDGSDDNGRYEAAYLARGTSFDGTHGISEQTVNRQ
jgi:hypothetical protein